MKVLGLSRRLKPAPLRYVFAGVRLAQMTIIFLEKTFVGLSV